MTIDSSDVTFSQGGTGATTRTVQAKLRENCVSVKDFGAVGDGTTDDYSAFQAALAFLATKKLPGIGGSGEDSTTYGSLPILFLPLGRYYVSQTIELKNGIADIEAVPGTLILNPASTHGLIIQSYDTTGETVESTPTTSAAGSTIRNLAFRSAGGTGLKHGIWMRGRAKLYNVSAINYPGDGIHIEADVGGAGATHGNDNLWYIHQAALYQNGRHGLYVHGGDTNAGCAIGIDAELNGRWGIFEDSFLGNTHIGHHADSNGVKGAGCTTGPNTSSSIVHYNGNLYSVLIGQETAASTTTPGTDGSVWALNGPGYASTSVPTWTSGGTYFSGGAYGGTSATAQNVFVGCYSEGSQGMSQIPPASLAIGGLQGANIRGPFLRGANWAVAMNSLRSGDVYSAYGELAGESSQRQVMNLVDAAYAPDGFGFRFEETTGDLVCRYANQDSWIPLRITGPGSTSPVGKYRLQVYGLGLGYGSDARMVTMGNAAPTTGYYREGTRIFYASPVAGGKEGLVCVQAGTPGVWKEFGSIQA